MKTGPTKKQLRQQALYRLEQALYRLERAEQLVNDLQVYAARAEADAASHGSGHDFWRGLDTGYESGFSLAAKWLAECVEMDLPPDRGV